VGDALAHASERAHSLQATAADDHEVRELGQHVQLLDRPAREFLEVGRDLPGDVEVDLVPDRRHEAERRAEAIGELAGRPGCGCRLGRAVDADHDRPRPARGDARLACNQYRARCFVHEMRGDRAEGDPDGADVLVCPHDRERRVAPLDLGEQAAQRVALEQAGPDPMSRLGLGPPVLEGGVRLSSHLGGHRRHLKAGVDGDGGILDGDQGERAFGLRHHRGQSGGDRPRRRVVDAADDPLEDLAHAAILAGGRGRAIVADTEPACGKELIEAARYQQSQERCLEDGHRTRRG
jgi:hypothetical protein